MMRRMFLPCIDLEIGAVFFKLLFSILGRCTRFSRHIFPQFVFFLGKVTFTSYNFTQMNIIKIKFSNAVEFDLKPGKISIENAWKIGFSILESFSNQSFPIKKTKVTHGVCTALHDKNLHWWRKISIFFASSSIDIICTKAQSFGGFGHLFWSFFGISVLYHQINCKFFTARIFFSCFKNSWKKLKWILCP